MEAPHRTQQNNYLTIASNQLDQKLQQAEAKKTCLALEVGMQAGMAIQLLQVEKLQLASLNRSLKDEVTQIKLHHSNELKSLIETNQAKITLVAKKVKAIVEKIDAYKNREECSKLFFSADDIKLLSNLHREISKFSLNHLKKYPEYPCKPETQISSQEQKIEFPFANALTLQEAEPMVKGLMQKYICTYQALEKEVLPLRILKREIDNKEMLIDFHKKQMQKIDSEEIKPTLKKILALVNFYDKRIQWEKLILVNEKLFITYSVTPYTRKVIIQSFKDKQLKKTNGLKNKMKEIISMLNKFTNPK